MNTNNSFEYIKSTATAGKVKTTLTDCIGSRTKNILSDIAKVYGISNISKLKKAELCEKIEKAILSEKDTTLAQLDCAEKKCFAQLCESEVTDLEAVTGECSNLVKKGLVYLFSSKEEYMVVVPEEFRVTQEVVFEQNPTFDQFIKAGINLYGYVEVAFLAKILANLCEKKEYEMEFKAYVEALDSFSNEFVLLDGHLVANNLMENECEKLNKIKEIIAGEPIYRPTLEQMEIYAVDGAFERTPETKKLCDFATSYVTGNKADSEKIVSEIISQHRMSTSYSIERYTARFAAHGYRFRNVQIEAKIVALLVDAIASVRLWAYRGYTVTEKKELLRSLQSKAAKRPVAPIVSPKINRNDPCPCGSGKKYKKCCGK